MENRYDKMVAAHRAKIDTFPMHFAFSDQQFEKGMAALGLTPDQTDQVVNIGSGGFIHKNSLDEFKALWAGISAEKQANIDADETGDGFIYDMFLSELVNHEYCITYSTEDTLDALGLTREDIANSHKLAHGLKRAMLSASMVD